MNYVLNVAAIGMILFAVPARSQHLWWETKNLNSATCLYGEITVLATHPTTYFCGANWHPGEPAGGYCGIQHNHPTERRTIFSIWDTSKTLNPRVSFADPKTIFNKFGGEGEGAHTHMNWDWKVGDTFQFFVQKVQGTPGTTDARYFVFDRKTNKWIHSATINSPNGDPKEESSVSTIGGGGLGSFLENFSGRDRDVPKLALYRLWMGNSVDTMKCLTQARGDGKWGQLHDAYFLAEGDENELTRVFTELKGKYGEPVFATKAKRLEPITNRPLPRKLIEQIQALKQKDSL